MESEIHQDVTSLRDMHATSVHRLGRSYQTEDGVSGHYGYRTTAGGTTTGATSPNS